MDRRTTLKGIGAFALAAGLPGTAFARGPDDPLVIAYPTPLPSLDPTDSPQSSHPAVQSIYKAVFDPYIDQAPDLEPKPGILTDWKWGPGKNSVVLTVRNDALWHDGTPVTPDDLVWSLARAADAANHNPMQFVWGKLGRAKIDGQVVTVELKAFEPALLGWMGFLTAFILPRKTHDAAIRNGTAIGSGPYRIDRFERDAFLRLKAFPRYRGPKPAFETVIFKFTPDPSTRVAEIESGSADIALDMSLEEHDRLAARPGLRGVTSPVSDLGILFIANRGPMTDRNVRLAAAHAIDKRTLVDRLLRGHGLPLDTLQAPQYAAWDPSIRVPFDPEKARALLAASGYSVAKPVRFTIQTTRGHKPRDFEMIQAVTGMWRKVGIEAAIDVVDIGKHLDMQLRGELPPVSFLVWGNAMGDPSTSTGAAMLGPFAVWKSDDVTRMMAPLMTERDEVKRLAGYRQADRVIADEGYAIPLLQYAQPIVMKQGLQLTPHVAGGIWAQTVRPA